MSEVLHRHLTPIDLDALEMDLIGSAERRPLEAHSASCAECSRRRVERRAHAERFSDRVFAHTLTVVRGRLAPRWRFVRWAVPLVAGAAALMMWLAPPGRHRALPELTAKGPPSLKVFARRAGQVFPVVDGAVLAPGDAIRFFVEPNGLTNVIIGSVDGAGKATIYYPYGGRQSAAVDPRKLFEVPGSIALDAAAGPERVFAVFSRHPLPGVQVQRALATLGARGENAIRQTGELPLPGTAQATVRFEKGELPR
jgi:hypothetical protein